MLIQSGLKIGTLGSPATFAGEATTLIKEDYPEFAEPIYFESLDECWAQLKKGGVDAIIVSIERTGQAHQGNEVIGSGGYVLGYRVLPIRCNLYVKPGTRKEGVQKILGHGSIHQCRTYLDKHFSGIPREVHGLNSLEAARVVMAGNGTEAVVGSASLPQVVTGIETLAQNIDDGAIASWWIISSKPFFSDQPTSLVITGRFGPDGKLGDLIASISKLGYRLNATTSVPVNDGISVYNYLLGFEGKGVRQDVAKAVAGFPTARLIGAFDNRG
jgi:prephenate dehydratase